MLILAVVIIAVWAFRWNAVGLLVTIELAVILSHSWHLQAQYLRAFGL